MSDRLSDLHNPLHIDPPKASSKAYWRPNERHRRQMGDASTPTSAGHVTFNTLVTPARSIGAAQPTTLKGRLHSTNTSAIGQHARTLVWSETLALLPSRRPHCITGVWQEAQRSLPCSFLFFLVSVITRT